ncbi:MAG TPA: LLM class flavin-dependent oxidoreductase [Candidatus Acidoferrales bacterium]|nr:LLM class flavin-dependent oxidoreductase [Candidatus Acidoferrales bacterium]
MATSLKFGLLLPHFGEHASIEKCIEGAKKAEAYGFDSVWVRDHLVFEPHGMEGEDNTHIEGLLVLAAVSSVCKKLTLGTGTIISHRHPIHLAQAMAALSTLSDGKVIMGLGLGTFPHEFAAAGYPNSLQDRANLARINAELCRRLWSGEKVTYKDQYFNFADVQLKPQPKKPIPIWYGGGTPASCRRAAEYCDGWLPGRIPMLTFIKMVNYLREQYKLRGRPMGTVGAIPIVSIDKDLDTALSKVNTRGLINEGNSPSKKTWVNHGKFSTFEDIRGLLLAGRPEDIVKDTMEYEKNGLNHIVYDLRFRFRDWYQQLDYLGKEVLPALRA